MFQGRIIDDFAEGGDNNYPRVALADSETALNANPIGDISFSTDVGSEMIYFVVTGNTEPYTTGKNAQVKLWIRRHWFNEEVE